MMTDFSETVKEWKETGYIKYVKWHTVNDENVCSVCKHRAGKKFLLSEIENLIPAHENCRCWFTPIVSEELFEEGVGENFEDIDLDKGHKSSLGDFLKKLFKKTQ
jgi:hypothetical protein